MDDLASQLVSYIDTIKVHQKQTVNLKTKRIELKEVVNKCTEICDMTDSMNTVGSEIGEVVSCLEDIINPNLTEEEIIKSNIAKNSILKNYKHSDKFKYIVKVSMGIKYMVTIIPSLCIVPVSGHIRFRKLKPGTRIALDVTTLTITHVLPVEVDPAIHFMALKPDSLLDVCFEKIGGLENEIQELREVIELPLTNPHLYDRIGIKAPKGVLLYGPPGTGKTLLAKAAAKTLNVNFLSVTASSLIEKYIGESSRMIRELFKYARNNAPSVIFIDEIDAIGSKRGNEHGCCDREVQRTLMELLNQLDGFTSLERIGVVMATNRPDILDEALLRPGRIDRKIEIGLPDLKGRLEILKIYTKNIQNEVIDLEIIAKLSEKFNGADLRHLVTEAGFNAMRKDRDFRIMEDYILAARKIGLSKKLETNLDYNK